MNKKKLNVKKVLIIVILLLVIIVLFPFEKNKDDFKIKVNGKEYNVIVAKPKEKLEQYPLVIYHHGGGYRTIEPFELRNLSKEFAKEGFLFWAPERTPGAPWEGLQTLKDAQAMSKAILDLAIKSPKVDKNNINIVSFCLGSWAAFENDVKSPNVKTVSLLNFGAPYDDTVLYDYVMELVNKTDYSEISPKILIMVSEEDSRVDIEAGETLRKKMVEANKTIDCVLYKEGEHLSLAGVKDYLKDLVKYLKDEKINTTESIKISENIRNKYKRYRTTGYW